MPKFDGLHKKAKLVATVTATKPLPKKKIFPFLSLPPELKNKIYDYTLTCDHEIPLISKARQYRHAIELGTTETFQKTLRQRRGWGYFNRSVAVAIPVTKPSLGPNLLLLNKEIHAETQPILYGANVFAFEDMKALHTFCANIRPKNCAALRELNIKHWGNSSSTKGANFAAFTVLASAINITRLNMDCEVAQGSWGTGKNIARQFYRDGHTWLEAVGLAKGKRDAAVDLIDLGLQNVNRPYVEDPSSSKHGQEELKKQKEKLAVLMAEFRKELRALLKFA